MLPVVQSLLVAVAGHANFIVQKLQTDGSLSHTLASGAWSSLRDAKFWVNSLSEDILSELR